MDIVIIANFCMDFSESDNGRFSYLARLLCADHEVEIITSDYYHTAKQRRCPLPQLPYRVTLIHEPGYAKNISLKRFFSHIIWGRNVKRYLAGRKKPDAVYCAIPSLDGPLFAAEYCERNGVRFVVDIQDLWPEAFEMALPVPSAISRMLFYPLRRKADGIYRRADAICAVSDTYGRRVLSVNKKCSDAATVYLGTELETFDRYAREQPILEKGEGEIWLAYCGTLGHSYDLGCVIDALAELDDGSVRFIVMGDGPRQVEFERYARQKGVDVMFMGRLPYEKMCSLLAACDIAVNPIVHGAAQSIINKHADYAAAGKPVVSTQESEEYRALVDGYQMGFNCENGSSADLAKKLRILMEDESLRRGMGANARRCAQERFDRKATYGLLADKVIGRRA